MKQNGFTTGSSRLSNTLSVAGLPYFSGLDARQIALSNAD